jgi:uncharacterized membrane protein YdjX (TVP38/TMEM64 family)
VGVLLVVLLLATAVLLARPVHNQLLTWVSVVEALIRHHPHEGKAVFLLLAATSALLAFFSSAVIVPLAVYAWGPRTCILLLWSGWLLGGVIAYAVGRLLGRPMTEALVPAGSLQRYEGRFRTVEGFVPVLLLQLAIPSDVACYLFGLARCRFRVFLPALATAEIPYALGAVYLGASFLQRNLLPLLAVGLAGVALAVLAYRAHVQQVSELVSDTSPLPNEISP